MTEPLASLFAHRVLGPLLYGVLFMALTWLVLHAVRLLVDGALRRDRRGVIDRTATRFLMQVLRVVVYVVALTAYFHVIPELRALGTVLLTGVSVASVVFGLAASTTLSNVIAGFSLLVLFPYRVDDALHLTVGGATEVATIEAINLGYTRLKTAAGETLIMPNSVLIATPVLLRARPDAVAPQR